MNIRKRFFDHSVTHVIVISSYFPIFGYYSQILSFKYWRISIDFITINVIVIISLQIRSIQKRKTVLKVYFRLILE